MNHPLNKVIDALRSNPNHIYAWIITTPDGSENTSIKIGLAEAREWCEDYASYHGGMVPCWFNSIETFLGYAPIK